VPHSIPLHALRYRSATLRIPLQPRHCSATQIATAAPTPHPQLRKIKQIAVAEKSAEKKLGEDRIRPSVYSPAQPFAPQPRYRSTVKSSKLQRPKICTVGCDVPRGVCT